MDQKIHFWGLYKRHVFQILTRIQSTNIICWDIGGKKGHFIELNGHTRSIAKLDNLGSRLYSICVGGSQIAWDMTKKREKAAEWAESDACQVTDAFPFCHSFILKQSIFFVNLIKFALGV